MTIIEVTIAELRQAEYNPRIMPEAELEALKKSIASFGFVTPLVVNNHECEKCGDRRKVLVGGHQRLSAVQGGQYETLPAAIVDLHLAQEKQLNIALNKTGGHFNTPKLKKLLRDTKEAMPDADLGATGFTKTELADLLAPIELPEPTAFAKVSDADQPDFTQMSFVLSIQQKATILEALNAIRRAESVPAGETDEETLGNAIVALAKYYNGVEKNDAI